MVSFEAGIKRGKVFVPTFTTEEQEEMKKKSDIAEKVKLDPDEEEALAAASLEDVMALADILNTNPQNFIMEAYADPLQYFEPDPPNSTDAKAVLEKLSVDDQEIKDVNLNNVSGIEEKQICEIFDTLRKNKNLSKLSVVNCDVSTDYKYCSNINRNKYPIIGNFGKTAKLHNETLSSSLPCWCNPPRGFLVWGQKKSKL